MTRFPALRRVCTTLCAVAALLPSMAIPQTLDNTEAREAAGYCAAFFLGYYDFVDTFSDDWQELQFAAQVSEAYKDLAVDLLQVSTETFEQGYAETRSAFYQTFDVFDSTGNPELGQNIEDMFNACTVLGNAYDRTRGLLE